MVSKTFVIIKPDGIRLIGEIIKRFEQKRLKIVALEMQRKSQTWCQLHYRHLTGEIYRNLEEFMLSGPLVGIVLEGESAVLSVKNLVGSTNSIDAPPGTIRGDFGTLPIYQNVVHAADSEEEAVREIDLFFNGAM